MTDKSNEPEKEVCPVTEHLEALRIRLHSEENQSPALRSALAEAGRMITEISLGRATVGHLDELAKAVKALPESEHSLVTSLETSLDMARDKWLMHITDSACNAGICFEPRLVPCQEACPAHIDIPSMIAHIGHGNYDASLSVLLKDTPLPNSCGLVCPAPCEEACVQKTVSQPVLIKPMKSIAARCSPSYPMQEIAPATGRKVAIIGAGPAGVTTAYYLAQKGHHVEIFDEREEPGGTMRYGIPNYRLPNQILQDEINQVRKMGVEIHNGYKVKNIREFQDQGFDATFVAIGLPFSRRLGIEGDDLPFVLGGMDFLSAVRDGKDPKVGPHVIVIGGGNAAIDVAMTAFRQGATKVQMWYRRTRKDMPANPHEVVMALDEGVELVELWAPTKIMEGNLIEFARSKNAPDADTAKPVTIRADQIIAGIGQDGDIAWLDGSKIELEWGNIVADPVTLETGEPGIFSGGDIQHGASTVVAAIGSGKRAAEAIDSWLMKKEMDLPSLKPQRRDEVPYLSVDAAFRLSKSRPHVPEKDPDTRKWSHDFIQFDWDENEARAEAGRCLRCDLCIGCGLCELACIQVGAEALRMVETGNRRLVFEDFLRPASLCIGCGACAAVCPTGAIRVENRDGMRVTEITGTVVRSQPLQVCSCCDKPFVSSVQYGKTRSSMGGPGETDVVMCSSCARLRAVESLSDMRWIAAGR
ncbi:FAD-dependent oxidoreductase [Oxalobacter vibrioformis]|uniref:dihydrouracil dehydrogenase (NAD(+)) n=1 Tax=Oxalobacter vibrioformis TaxID=933080 RepID=A0A9E9P2K8_9BURK|nr:FAD-dependent oxidoreductase [Oxalobacter vibrioformis]WAW09330.1 FAD-dependent oxidoreductase [Oxalobacter vibrioformis]